MKSVNKVFLMGSLGKEPETKYTPGGTAVSKFSLATNEPYKDKGGVWAERTEWHSIVCWQRLAELANQYLHKGSKVFIEGRIGTQSWEDKTTGEKKYRTEITATNLVFIDTKDSESQGSSKAEDENQDAPF